MSYISDEYYIDRVLKGDKSSYALLVERHKNMVFTITNRLMKSREEAEEVAQDAFLKAYRSLKKFRKQSKFSTWLYKIVYNQCISELRKKAQSTVSVDDEEYGGFDLEDTYNKVDSLENADRKYFIDKAVAQLNEDERMIITLYYQNEMNVDHIADIMNMTASNIKIKLYRSRKKLYAKLHTLLRNEIGTLL
jgi:RNA polymerase sigma-70 factor (ECF subfamily)